MSRTPHPLGSGRDARASPLDDEGPLRGARWIVRSTPERLVRIAAEFLEGEGFETRADGFTESVRDRGVEWTAVTLEIGDDRRSRRGWWRGLTDDLPFAMSRARRHVLPPTLVVAAARPVVTGVAELVVFPHASAQGEETDAGSAATRVGAALDRITAAAGAEGAMLSHESLSELADDEAPASSLVVSEILGWR